MIMGVSSNSGLDNPRKAQGECRKSVNVKKYFSEFG